jgi:hypothetical protein
MSHFERVFPQKDLFPLIYSHGRGRNLTIRAVFPIKTKTASAKAAEERNGISLSAITIRRLIGFPFPDASIMLIQLNIPNAMS